MGGDRDRGRGQGGLLASAVGWYRELRHAGRPLGGPLTWRRHLLAAVVLVATTTALVASPLSGPAPMPVGRGVLLLSPFMVAAHVGWWLSHRWGTWRSALAVAGALAALMGVWVLVWSCTSANYCAFPQALQMAVVVAALALVSTALGRSVAWPARAAGRGLAHLYRKVRHARDEN